MTEQERLTGRSDMKALVKRLDKWLKKNHPDYYALLFPGLKPKEIKDFEDWLGFRLPQAWKDLYAWRNGQFEADLQTEPHLMQTFQRNMVFDRLDSIKDSYTELKGLLECGQFEKKNWWNNQWVPFLTSNGVNHYCVDMEGTFRGKPGQIVYFYHDTVDRAIEFPSLEAWLVVQRGFR